MQNSIVYWYMYLQNYCGIYLEVKKAVKSPQTDSRASFPKWELYSCMIKKIYLQTIYKA